MVQMLGWFRADAARASRRKRSSACGSFATGEEFKLNKAAEFDVLRLVNHAHPAATEFLDHAIVGNGLANHSPACYEEKSDKSMKVDS
jgi:hypothetical protein